MAPPLSVADMHAQFAPVRHASGLDTGRDQATLRETVRFEGVGLHSGEIVRVALHPAGADTGIVFARSDAPSVEAGRIEAIFANVCDVTLSTKIGNAHGYEVSTVEHLMAALAGLGVDNLIVEIDGAEVPIMDGSSDEFVSLIKQVGLQYLSAPRRMLRIKRPVRVEHNGSMCELLPEEACAFEAEIDFEASAIGRQSFDMTLTGNGFEDELANARTFCLRDQIDAMHANGLARGGSLANAIVVDGEKILNADGLRVPNEFVRHKLLDAVGDMYLAGMQILGRYRGYKSGHALHNVLLKALFQEADAFDVVTLDAEAAVIAAE